MMSRKDAVTVASRTLAVLLSVWALTELSHLPGALYSFLRYSQDTLPPTAAIDYWRHNYLISLSFNVTRIVGFGLMSRWLFRGGPEIEELLLPASEDHSNAVAPDASIDIR
jgi:hypothetical protein